MAQFVNIANLKTVDQIDRQIENVFFNHGISRVAYEGEEFWELVEDVKSNNPADAHLLNRLGLRRERLQKS